MRASSFFAALLLVLAGLVTTGLVHRAHAAPAFPSAFVVSDIPVSADGKSGTAARDAARIGGQRQALQVVLQRLTQQSDWSHLPSPDDKTITNLVLDFQVQKERMTPGHYVGTYTFRFDPRRIRALLQKAGMNSSELVSKPVIIVPVIAVGGATHLWDDPNPWRDAWNAANGHSGLVPWIVPLGDLGDVQAFDVPQAQNPTPDSLAALSKLYDGGDPVIATATETDGDQGARLDITITRFTQGGKEQGKTSVSAPKADAGFYAAGVVAARGVLEGLWKQGPGTGIPTLSAANAQTYQLTIPVSSVAEWAKIRDHLDHVEGVSNPQIIVMAQGQVVLSLKMAADPQTMRVAFSQQDLVLTPGDGGGTVQLAASGARPLDQTPAGPGPVPLNGGGDGMGMNGGAMAPQPAPQPAAPQPAVVPQGTGFLSPPNDAMTPGAGQP